MNETKRNREIENIMLNNSVNDIKNSFEKNLSRVY